MKYMGSKARIAKHILPIILKNRRPGQYYVEPLVGGFNALCKVVGNRIAADSNKYLIALFRALQSGWQPDCCSKDLYLQVRDNKNDFPLHVVGWIGFGCSYSGKFFAGYAGETNTAVGTVRNYQAETIRNIQKQAQALKDVEIYCCGYDQLIIPENSIIYCDPPYEGTTGYKSTFDHPKFWQWCRNMTIKGHSVFISEYNAPPDFECIWHMEFKSSLSANGKSGASKNSVEKLFVFRPDDFNENINF